MMDEIEGRRKVALVLQAKCNILRVVECRNSRRVFQMSKASQRIVN
jgi:hypothetical protein